MSARSSSVSSYGSSGSGNSSSSMPMPVPPLRGLLFVVVNEAEGLERLCVPIIELRFPRNVFGSFPNTVPGVAGALGRVGGEGFELGVHRVRDVDVGVGLVRREPEVGHLEGLQPFVEQLGEHRAAGD